MHWYYWNLKYLEDYVSIKLVTKLLLYFTVDKALLCKDFEADKDILITYYTFLKNWDTACCEKPDSWKAFQRT